MHNYLERKIIQESKVTNIKNVFVSLLCSVVLNMVGKNPHVHTFHHDANHKFPSVIMCPKNITKLLRRSCSRSSTRKSVLGFGKFEMIDM